MFGLRVGWGGVRRESRSRNVEVGKGRVGSGPRCVRSAFREAGPQNLKWLLFPVSNRNMEA